MNGGSRICVKNLGKSTNEKQLKDLFGTKGEVTDVRIVKTKSGKSRQLAFLGFRTDIQAQEAINYFNNTFLETARILVESAKKIGDQSLIDTTRSKITKKKLENASKGQAVQLVKLKNEKILAVENSLIKETSSKEKKDFMEAMKPRRTTQFWANDESLSFDSVSNIEESMDQGLSDKNGKIDSNSDNESEDVDDDDINDFTSRAIIKKNNKNSSSLRPSKFDNAIENKEKNMKKVTAFSKVVETDMDYLRSKVKAHFSDEDGDSDDESMEYDDDRIQKTNKSNMLHKAQVNKAIQGSTEDSTTSFAVASSFDSAAVDEEDDNEDSDRLFIRNLTFSCSEDEMKKLFEQFGLISSIHLPLDSEKKGNIISVV